MIALGGSATALAQTAADPGAEPAAPPVAAPVQAPAAAPTPPVADTANLAARLDEIEQLARISDRKREILEEDLAKKAKETPGVTADDGGFAIRSADRAYSLRFRTQLQVDGRFFLDNATYSANDTFLVRRFRPGIDGTLFSFVDYRLVPDLAGGSVQIMEGYVDLRPGDWLRLRGGKFKGVNGLERLQSDADLPIFERALDQNLSAQREFGAQLWGNLGAGFLTYVVNVVNGAADNTNPDTTDTNHAKDFQGRLFFRPFKLGLDAFGDLGLGVSASTGERKGKLPTAVSGATVPTAASVTGLGSYKTAGQNTFFSYYAPVNDTTGAGTTFGNGRASHLNPQLYYYVGPFGLLAEYIWSKQAVQRGNSTADLTNQAAHATASFVIGGREGYDGPTPEYGFDTERANWARWSWRPACRG